MNIEIFEKIGEITIPTLRPASENRVIAEKENAKKEERERKEKKEKAIRALSVISDDINWQASKGFTRTEILFPSKKLSRIGISWESYLNVEDIVIPILKSMGYKIYTHKYSGRDGDFGDIQIYW